MSLISVICIVGSVLVFFDYSFGEKSILSVWTVFVCCCDDDLSLIVLNGIQYTLLGSTVALCCAYKLMVNLFVRRFSPHSSALVQEWCLVDKWCSFKSLVFWLEACDNRKYFSAFTHYMKSSALDDINFRLRAVKRRDFCDVYCCHSRSSKASI